MRVDVVPKSAGTHRVEYDLRWYAWALPLRIALGTSYYPTAESGLDVNRWVVQRVLIFDVLCAQMRIVLSGPLFDDIEDEGEG